MIRLRKAGNGFQKSYFTGRLLIGHFVGKIAINQNKRLEVLGGELVVKGQCFQNRERPSGQNELLDSELVCDCFNIPGASRRVVAMGDSGGLTLRARVDGNDSAVLCEMPHLEFEYVSRHQIAWNKEDGRERRIL